MERPLRRAAVVHTTVAFISSATFIGEINCPAINPVNMYNNIRIRMRADMWHLRRRRRQNMHEDLRIMCRRGDCSGKVSIILLAYYVREKIYVRIYILYTMFNELASTEGLSWVTGSRTV